MLDVGKDGTAVFENYVERMADDVRLEYLGFGYFRDRSAGSAIAGEHDRIDAWQMFPALVGDEPDIIVGVDLDLVHVFDTTDLLFVGAVEQIPAVVHRELRREVTVRFSHAHLAAILRQI